MKKILTLSLVLVIASALPANARTHTTFKPTHTKIARYGYTYHRAATVKCPYFGCRRSFTHN